MTNVQPVRVLADKTLDKMDWHFIAGTGTGINAHQLENTVRDQVYKLLAENSDVSTEDIQQTVHGVIMKVLESSSMQILNLRHEEIN
jgi:regulatory protein YycH of two-component signal transduction system YycFG